MLSCCSMCCCLMLEDSCGAGCHGKNRSCRTCPGRTSGTKCSEIVIRMLLVQTRDDRLDTIARVFIQKMRHPLFDCGNFDKVSAHLSMIDPKGACRCTCCWCGRRKTHFALGDTNHVVSAQSPYTQRNHAQAIHTR